MSDETTTQVEQPVIPEQNGVQKRIDELTAARYAEIEKNQELSRQLMEAAQREAELARQLVTNRAPAQVAAPADPYSAFADKVDPSVLQAMRERDARVEAQFAQRLQAQQAAMDAQIGLSQLRQMGAQLRNVPAEVLQRAEQLFTQWRNSGWLQPSPQDALHIALGQHTAGAGQLPLPNRQAAPAVLPGYAPAPPQRQPAAVRPANFEQLSPREQNAQLEKEGVADAIL